MWTTSWGSLGKGAEAGKALCIEPGWVWIAGCTGRQDRRVEGILSIPVPVPGLPSAFGQSPAGRCSGEEVGWSWCPPRKHAPHPQPQLHLPNAMRLNSC